MNAKPLIVAITNGKISTDDFLQQITLPTTGAVLSFTGVVRGETGEDHQVTSALEYEAYEPMAKKMMKQVAEEIWERWPTIEWIAIVQRVGKLLPQTPTTLIACAAAHRDTGVFEAARYGIDRLKEIVPVWKKEIGPSGETWVEGHHHPKAE